MHGVYEGSIDGINFKYDFKLDPYIRRMYAGLYERHITSFLKNKLKKGDTFIDVGANIGFVSAYAASLVGKSGSIHAFEPVSEYCDRLYDLAQRNPDYDFQIVRAIVAEKEGMKEIAVSDAGNIGWNTCVPGYMPLNQIGRMEKVPSITLSGYIRQKGLKNIRIIKIDVEGFEFPILLGLEHFLTAVSAEDIRPYIVCEFRTDTLSCLGYNEKDIKDWMKKVNYKSYNLSNFRPVDLSMIESTVDLLFKPTLN